MPPPANPQDGERSSSSPPRSHGREDTSGSQNPGAEARTAQVADPDANAKVPVPRTEHELAQAFRDLARGEQAATALEANLTSLESKLDELLASFESAAGELPPTKNGGAHHGPDEKRRASSEPQNDQDVAGN